MSVLLEVRDAVKRFGGVAAVDGASISVNAGETLAIIGPNGSGKSTLFDVIAGAQTLDGGRIIFDGTDITALSADVRAARGIARTFQNGRVFGNLTLHENVLAGERAHLRAARPFTRLRAVPLLRWLPLLAETFRALVPSRRQSTEWENTSREADRELGRFGERLLPRRNERAYAQSYANRRRVEIARALALAPRVLLLDEPAAGMNPSETLELVEYIAQLRSSGLTIVLVEHKLDMIAALADRTIVLDEGKVIFEGTPEQARSDERVIAAYLGRPTHFESAAPPTITTETPLLELRSLDVKYGAFTALHGVSLHVNSGEIVCLLGGNASGKSTTLKSALGLIAPASGAVFIDGRDVTAWAPAGRIRAGLASVPEARRVFPGMTVEENLLVGAFVRRDSVRSDVEHLYNLFPRLRERRGQAAGTLSGGEQQMLALARALMSRPRLLCMDEPTMGLAPVVAERVLERIVEINRTGTAILMVEQNASAALRIAHRGYVLRNGELVVEGPAKALLEDPAVQAAYLGG